MSNVVDSSLSIGSDFYNLLKRLDKNNAPVDDSVENYLNKNPKGLSFTYKNKEYFISKKSADEPIQLHVIENGKAVLKDPDVQLNSKYTPDGSVELGGLVEAGMRVYIFRSSENNEEVLAYAAKDGSYKENRADSVLLYTGEREKPVNNNQPKPEPKPEPKPAPAPAPAPVPVPVPVPVEQNPTPPPTTEPPIVETPIEVEPGTPVVKKPTLEIVDPYARLDKLPDGIYSSKDGQMFDSNGNVLADSWYEDGTYKVLDGEAYSVMNVPGGETLYLPIHGILGFYQISRSCLDADGKLSDHLMSYGQLRKLGIDTQNIELPFVFLGSKASHAKLGSLTVRVADDNPNTMLLISGSGENEVVLGETSLMEAGTYMARKNSAGNMVLYKEHVNSSKEYMIPHEVYSGDMLIDSPVLVKVQGEWQEVNSTADLEFLNNISFI